MLIDLPVVTCPLSANARCTLQSIRQVVAERGHLTIEEDDTGSRRSFAQHDDVSIVADYRLTQAEWFAAVEHECNHLRRGPVPPEEILTEEVRVRTETAANLFPVGSALQQLDYPLTVVELRGLAHRYGADPAVVRDGARGVTLPAIPTPRISSETRASAEDAA